MIRELGDLGLSGSMAIRCLFRVWRWVSGVGIVAYGRYRVDSPVFWAFGTLSAYGFLIGAFSVFGVLFGCYFDSFSPNEE
jgi:hypothetical protein